MVKAFARVLAAGGFLLMAFQSGTDERVERRTRRRRLDPARGAAGMKVVVADDQTAVRDGLITILEHLDGIEVVGAAADGATAVALAEQHVSHDVRRTHESARSATGWLAGPFTWTRRPSISAPVAGLRDGVRSSDGPSSSRTRPGRLPTTGVPHADRLRDAPVGQDDLRPEARRTLPLSRSLFGYRVVTSDATVDRWHSSW
jgi:hypothetical protein